MSGALSPSLRPLSKDIDQTTAPLPHPHTQGLCQNRLFLHFHDFIYLSLLLLFQFSCFIIFLFTFLQYLFCLKITITTSSSKAFRSQRLHFSVCSSLLCKPYKAFQNKGLRHGWKRFILFFMLVRCRT